jgi:hypothetical protein
MSELWERVQEVWTNVQDEFLQKLYASMPKHMLMLYERKGDAIDY